MAFEEVSRCAAERGIRVTGTEIVGVVPLSSLIDAGKYFLQKQRRSGGIADKEIIKIAIKSMGLDELYPFESKKKVIEYLIIEDAKKQLVDMASDVSVANASSGHFVSINQYYADQYSTELNDIWSYGYKVVDRCVRTINGANTLLPETTSEADLATLYRSLSQSYSLRALANFYLVNIFGYPYKDGGNNTQLGIVLLTDKPIEPFEHIARSTVEETYAQILSDIQNAKDNYALYITANGGDGLSAFYMNEAAIYALEARVRLFMVLTQIEGMSGMVNITYIENRKTKVSNYLIKLFYKKLYFTDSTGSIGASFLYQDMPSITIIPQSGSQKILGYNCQIAKFHVEDGAR